MSDNTVGVTFSVAANFAAKIDRLQEEANGKYVVDEMVYNKAILVYKNMRRFALLNDGIIEDTEISPELVDMVIIADVPFVDLYKEGLDGFKELLGLVDSLDCRSSGEESILVEVRINGLWKAVDAGE